MTSKQKFVKAMTLKDEGKLEESLIYLKEIESEFSNSVQFSLAMGNIYRKMDRSNEALVCFRKATRLDPKFEFASLGVFHTLWDLDMIDKALAEIRRFQTISHSEDYVEIIKELHDKWIKEGGSRNLPDEEPDDTQVT